MRPEVRPMTKEDKPALIQMLRNIPEFKSAEIDVAEEVINSYLRDSVRSGYHVLVAEVNSSITGYICYGPTPLTEGTWDIYWLAVAPDKQSQGIGKTLLDFADGNIKEKDGRLILIETSSKPEYEPTRLFYQSQGYETACRIVNFYAPGDDKLVFQKRLR
jgi:ribosomal protein S18 acetylase RimI-like enzyme